MSTVTRNRSVTNVEWAVYELDKDGNPNGGYWNYPSRAAARNARDGLNADTGETVYGVFRRLVSVTRD